MSCSSILRQKTFKLLWRNHFLDLFFGVLRSQNSCSLFPGLAANDVDTESKNCMNDFGAPSQLGFQNLLSLHGQAFAFRADQLVNQKRSYFKPTKKKVIIFLFWRVFFLQIDSLSINNSSIIICHRKSLRKKTHELPYWLISHHSCG